METTRLLNNGQVPLPEFIRRAHKWNTGQELIILNVRDGVLLISKTNFEPRTLDEVAGCLKYPGPAKTLEEIEIAVSKGVKQAYADRH